MGTVTGMTTGRTDGAFSRDGAELALSTYLDETSRIAYVEIFDVRDEGVVAFERLDGPEAGKVDWDHLATEVSAMTGLPVANVADAELTLADGRTVDATYVAFDVPRLDPDHADLSRTRLSDAYLEAHGLDAAPAPRM